MSYIKTRRKPFLSSCCNNIIHLESDWVASIWCRMWSIRHTHTWWWVIIGTCHILRHTKCAMRSFMFREHPTIVIMLKERPSQILILFRCDSHHFTTSSHTCTKNLNLCASIPPTPVCNDWRGEQELCAPAAFINSWCITCLFSGLEKMEDSNIFVCVPHK